MANGSILARQHFETLSRLCPTECVYLSGTIKGAARRKTLAAIADGTAKIVIGTHALFQDGVTFHDRSSQSVYRGNKRHVRKHLHEPNPHRCGAVHTDCGKNTTRNLGFVDKVYPLN